MGVTVPPPTGRTPGRTEGTESGNDWAPKETA